MRAAWALFALLGALSAPLLAEKLKPLVSVFGTCAGLTPNTYPSDSQNWFDGSKQAQVVFYAHMLFPLRPEQKGPAAPQAWRIPLRVTPAAQVEDSAPAFNDEFYAQAEWFDPSGHRIAFYGLTFAARIRTDYVQVDGRWYAPHTFAMAIGTRDLRADAGQILLPEKVGQYHVRFSVDGEPTGVAFFRMLKGGTAPSASSDALGTGKAAAALMLSNTGKALGLTLPAGLGGSLEP